MTQTYLMFAVTGAFVAGWLGAAAIRRLAPRLRLVQPPNERSSHSTPTPQGGGIAVAVVAIVTAFAAGLGDHSIMTTTMVLMVISGLGLADDIFNLSPAVRFPVQTVMLTLLVSAVLPLPDLALPLIGALPNGVLVVATCVAAIWWLNLFNFMDGIDGIAACHAIAILGGGVTIAALADQSFVYSPIGLLALTSAAATAGFLLLNWAPARIFMGDTGSNALAVVVLAVALSTIHSGLVGYEVWLIMSSVLVTDATVALVRRGLRGERPWRAHRRHAYQQLSRRWGHARVTTIYTAITALAAFPLAIVSQNQPTIGWWTVGAVYGCLTMLMVAWGSGSATEEPNT